VQLAIHNAPSTKMIRHLSIDSMPQARKFGTITCGGHGQRHLQTAENSSSLDTEWEAVTQRESKEVGA